MSHFKCSNCDTELDEEDLVYEKDAAAECEEIESELLPACPTCGTFLQDGGGLE